VFRAKFIDVQLRSNPTDGRYLAPNFGGKETRIRASLPFTHKKPQERATVAFVIVIAFAIAIVIAVG
jgi:hypothetical protein